MVAWVRSWGFGGTSGRFIQFAIIPILLTLIAGCGGGGTSSGGGGSSPTITSVTVLAPQPASKPDKRASVQPLSWERATTVQQ